MSIQLKAGMAAAALAAVAFAAPASAADLGGGKRGSIKDGGYEPAYVQPARGPAGPCYFRGDLGYSFSKDPTVKWAVTNFDRTYYTDNTLTTVAAAPTAFYVDGNYTYTGDSVTDTSMENALFGGVGIGCGMGSRGLRGELMLGYTGHRKIQGIPGDFVITEITSGGPTPGPVDDPLHTGVKSYTGMVNAYYDLGNWGGITPYVGAGVGVSYNKMDEVYFTGNPLLTNRIEGDSRLSLAWSLMAGIGWQITDRAILDIGYRYMDYGKANSGRIDSAGYVNPAVRVDDLTAHEIKVGLRYHFGGGCCDAPAYAPMK